MLKIIIPEKVNNVLTKLHKAGYEAYIVGGCVRDSILGRMPHDWDVTTNALPEQVKEVFKDTIDTGLKHGTVTVKDGMIEVTTYRIDGEYSDNRHPDAVKFVSSLEEDLKRRDFTINAMAYNEEEGLKDFFGGQEDIKNKLIKCVGDPETRFTEDALRIMRAVRFSAQLGFNIEFNTSCAMKKLSENLENVSMERKYEEFRKTLMSKDPSAIRDYKYLNTDCNAFNTFNHILRRLPMNKEDYTILTKTSNFYCRMILLYYLTKNSLKDDLDLTNMRFVKEYTANTFLGLKPSSQEVKYISNGIARVFDWEEGRGKKFNHSIYYIKELYNEAGKEEFDIFLNTIFLIENLPVSYTGKIWRICFSEPIMLKDIAFNGTDALEMGYTGCIIGEIMKDVQQMIWSFPENNKKDFIKCYVKTKFG